MSTHSTLTSTPAKHGAGFQISSLDGIRALSFLLVFAGHAVPIPMTRFIAPGFGVTVFFFLSGYLITTLMRLEHDDTGTVGLKHFYLRRVLRILPPFYITFLLAVVLAKLGVIGGAPTVTSITAVSLQLTNYWEVFHGFDGLPQGTGVFWSLAVEEHFYLAFPLIYLWLRSRGFDARQQGRFILGLCGVVLAWRLVLVATQWLPHSYNSSATDCRVDSILFGCSLAVWGNPYLDSTRFSERTWKTVLLPLSFALILISAFIRHPLMNQGFRTTLQGLALIPLFVVAVRYPKWLPCRPLNTRVLAYVGTLSYTLYLVHHIIIFIFHQNAALHPLTLMVVSLGLSFVFAIGMYNVVEKPCAALRRKLARHALAVPTLANPTKSGLGSP